MKPLHCVLIFSALLPSSAFAADTSARDWAAGCIICHGTDKQHGTIPSLAGRSKAELIATMQAFRDGARPATVMWQIARGYTPEQLEAIADYFSRQVQQ